MTTKNSIIVFIIVSFILILSYQKVNKQNENTIAQAITQTNSKTEALFKQKCMICHDTEGKTDETMLAPPFYQVKKRYLGFTEKVFIIFRKN